MSIGRIVINTKKNRESNIELLRIISMLLILFHHGVVHGNLDFYGTLSLNKLFLSLFIFGGKFGVNVFVLISGYYLCKGNFSIRKFAKVASEILFYIIFVLSIVSIFFTNFITIDRFLLSIYPFQGFAVNYLFLYILSPYLNKAIEKLSREDYRNLLFICTVILSILPTFLPRFDGFYLLSWMIFLYFVGSYIRIYIDFNKIRSYHNVFLKLALLFIVLTNIIAGVVHIFKENLFFKYIFWINERTFFADNSFILFIASTAFFLYFLGVNIRQNKVINFISANMFGVLLIHDRPFRFLIFENLLKFPKFQYEIWFPEYYLISLILIFLFGVLISGFRLHFLESFMTQVMVNFLVKMRKLIYEKLYFKF